LILVERLCFDRYKIDYIVNAPTVFQIAIEFRCTGQLLWEPRKKRTAPRQCYAAFDTYLLEIRIAALGRQPSGSPSSRERRVWRLWGVVAKHSRVAVAVGRASRSMRDTVGGIEFAFIMPRIFISYSTKDGALINRLALDLRQSGAEVWLADWDIGVGDDIRLAIERGIEISDYFLIALSATSVNSRWVQHELTAGLARHIERQDAKILPVKLSDCQIPLLIAGKKYADFSQNYDQGFAALLDTIGIVFCTDVSNALSRAFVARRGEGGSNASPIAYGMLGTGPGLVFHWLIESIGQRQAAIRATGEAFYICRSTCEMLLSRAGTALRNFPEPFMTLIFSLINLTLRHAPIDANSELGTKAILALKLGDIVHVAELGSCSGLARWAGNNGEHRFRRLTAASLFAPIAISERNRTLVHSAPLGHMEVDDALIADATTKFLIEEPVQSIGHLSFETVKVPLVNDSDFVALTSFALPSADKDMGRVIDRVADTDACEAASRLCEFRPQRSTDCVCALIKRA
jgi:hypothetical protein